MSGIRTRDALTPLDELSLIDISYSRLNTFDMCQAKYFYTYILREERVFGAPAALGNIVHSVLENTDWTKPLNISSLHELYREYRPKYDPSYDIDDKLIDVGYQILNEFVDRHDKDKFKVLAVELPFHIILGTAAISGYIDRLDRDPDGTIHIIDFKTGRHEVTYKNIATDLQLGIYALAISQLFPAEQQIKAELYYLRSGRRKAYVFNRSEIDQIEKNLLSKINTLINTNEFRYTEQSNICSFCDHRKLCPVGRKRFPER